MLANIDFTDLYRTNPPSPLEDLKWFLSADFAALAATLVAGKE
jgi:hypothetical protein